MTAEQAMAAAKIIRDVAASHYGWDDLGYYPLAEALEEYARQIIAAEEEAGRIEAAREAAKREAFDDLLDNSGKIVYNEGAREKHNESL